MAGTVDVARLKGELLLGSQAIAQEGWHERTAVMLRALRRLESRGSGKIL